MSTLRGILIDRFYCMPIHNSKSNSYGWPATGVCRVCALWALVEITDYPKFMLGLKCSAFALESLSISPIPTSLPPPPNQNFKLHIYLMNQKQKCDYIVLTFLALVKSLTNVNNSVSSSSSLNLLASWQKYTVADFILSLTFPMLAWRSSSVWCASYKVVTIVMGQTSLASRWSPT